MNKPIKVLYAHPAHLKEEAGTDSYPRTPVVRHSDHSAKVQELVKEIEQLTATCERLQAELTVARYGQQAVNTLVEAVQNPKPKDSLASYEEKIEARDRLGRWDGKPKAL